MFQTFKNAWKVPSIRNKLLFTALILLLYRLGTAIYVPFIDTTQVGLLGDVIGNGIFEFVNLLSGQAFSQGTLFALSVTPYITASIVMQLLTIALPPLERLSKQGEEGKKKITAITRWVTMALALITAYGYVKLIESSRNPITGASILLFSKSNGFGYYFGMAVMIAALCAGAAIIMWMAELINDHGIGNGISMILFANILSTCNSMISQMVGMLKVGGDPSAAFLQKGALAGGIVKVVLSVALTLAAIVLIVWFTNSERRIPIQYAKRVVGRKMYGGQSSNLPLKMNMAGVMPVIFASSIVSIPATITGFIRNPNNKFKLFVEEWLGPTSFIYIILFIVLIFAFSYFYIMISFNPVEVANNIRSNGGSIPGIRPGKPTSDYIKKILNRITLLGAVFLVVIAGVPMIVSAVCAAFDISFTSIAFTGTSLLIVVGVALETVRDLEAQLAMRNYKGFLD